MSSAYKRVIVGSLFLLIFGVGSSSLAQSSSKKLIQKEKNQSEKSNSDEKILNEEDVLSLFRKNSVTQKSEIAEKAQVQLNDSLNQENYQARLYSTYNFKKSQERALNNFQPIFSPYEDWNVGVEKNLALGLKTGVEVFGTQYSFQDNSVQDATQMGARINAQVDLWKNIFGRLDRARLTSTESQKKRAELQYNVGIKKRESEVRKVYWSFVSNTQSIELAEELVSSAEKQYKDATSRQREGLADKGEVARYQSQVESRKASLLLFKYQRELILQAFEKQFDNFKSAGWTIEKDIDAKKIPLVQQCIQSISGQSDMNLGYTQYDEMIELLQKETDAEISAAKKHGDIDLALVGQYQTTGVSNSYSDAQTNLENEKKSGYAVGVQLSIPLGTSKSDSEKYLLTAKKSSLEAQKMAMMNELRSTHDTMMKAMVLLNMGLKSQVENSKNLDINYREMLKKYRQGRISVSNLVLEQDALFQSKLQEIDIKKQIAHVVLDYFTVFNQYPCDWNKI